MTNTPYTEADLNYSNDLALKPQIIATRFKQVYQKTLIGRSLMGTETVQTDAVSYFEEQDVTGSVNWISEQGGFPSLDFETKKRSKAIRPYGAYFDVTMMEMRFSQVNTIARKIERAAYRMRAFEDSIIFNALLTTSGVNTIADGSNWTAPTGAGAGDPIADLEQAKRLIRDATYLEPTDIIMSSLMYERLSKFDTIRNKLYNSQGFVEKGEIPTLVGLNILVDNAIDPADAGQIAVVRRNAFGYLAEAIPLNTLPVPGVNVGNIMVDMRYYNLCMAEPVMDAPEFICVISGLKS